LVLVGLIREHTGRIKLRPLSFYSLSLLHPP